MATEKVGVLVDMSVRGQSAVQGASASLKDLEGTTGGARRGFGELAVGIGAFVGVATGAVFAVKKLYDGLRAGATLITTQERFDKLAKSIDTTSDAMLGKLQAATKGMISDMDLMASASQIISLRLADNEDQVIRLASVVGQLGWDMNILIAEMNNMTGLRLDALGLSLNDVKERANELKNAGVEAGTAWREAIIQLGEAKLEIGGVSESEQAFLRAEAAVTNLKNALLESTVATLDQAGAFDALSNAATRLSLVQQITELDAKLREAGIQGEGAMARIARSTGLANMTTTQLAVEAQKLANQLALVDPVVETGAEGWRQYGVVTNTALMGIEYELDVLRFLAGDTTAAVAQGAAEMAGAVTAAQQTIIAGYIGNADAIREYVREQGNAVSSGIKLTRFLSGLGGKFKETEQDVYSYAATLGGVSAAAQAVADAHSRMAAAFGQELSSEIADGLINEEGLVNMEAANSLLFEQARAAGATASQLAMLGIATGQFTQEQAAAALKAAILSEKIKQIAEAVASGQLGYGEAAGSLASFGEQLNAGAIADVQAGIDGAAQAADDFAAGSYEASISVQSAAAMTAIADAQYALDNLSGTYTVNIVANGPYATGPQIVANATNSGGATVAGDNRSGGTHYNVTVTNIVDGKSTGRTALDDVTTDSIKRAMSEMGMGKR